MNIKKVYLGEGESVSPKTIQDPYKVPVYVACHENIVVELNRFLLKNGINQSSAYELWIKDGDTSILDALKKIELFKHLYKVVGYGVDRSFGRPNKNYVVLSNEYTYGQDPITTFMGFPCDFEVISPEDLKEEDFKELESETSKIDFSTPIFLPDSEYLSEEEISHIFGVSIDDIDFNIKRQHSVDRFIICTKKFLSETKNKPFEEHLYLSTLISEVSKEDIDNYMYLMKLNTIKIILKSLSDPGIRAALLTSFSGGVGIKSFFSAEDVLEKTLEVKAKEKAVENLCITGMVETAVDGDGNDLMDLLKTFKKGLESQQGEINNLVDGE